MKNFHFWQKWLFIVGVSLSVFGLCLAFFSRSAPMDFFFNKRIDPYFWEILDIPENSMRFRSWIYGVLGAVIAGWGILIAFWARFPFRTREKWAWNGLTFSTGVWFLADTAISAFSGVIFNVVVNTAILVVLALPLIFTKKYFLK